MLLGQLVLTKTSTCGPVHHLSGCLCLVWAFDSVLEELFSAGRHGLRWAGAPSSGPSDRCAWNLRSLHHEGSSALTSCWLLRQTHGSMDVRFMISHLLEKHGQEFTHLCSDTIYSITSVKHRKHKVWSLLGRCLKDLNWPNKRGKMSLVLTNYLNPDLSLCLLLK